MNEADVARMIWRVRNCTQKMTAVLTAVAVELVKPSPPPPKEADNVTD